MSKDVFARFRADGANLGIVDAKLRGVWTREFQVSRRCVETEK